MGQRGRKFPKKIESNLLVINTMTGRVELASEQLIKIFNEFSNEYGNFIPGGSCVKVHKSLLSSDNLDLMNALNYADLNRYIIDFPGCGEHFFASKKIYNVSGRGTYFRQYGSFLLYRNESFTNFVANCIPARYEIAPGTDDDLEPNGYDLYDLDSEHVCHVRK